MNERVNELFDNALDEVIPNTWTNLNMDQLNDIKNKFAELIVRECIDIISPYTVKMSRPGEEYLHPISEIKKHFGVEESQGWVCSKCGIDRTKAVCPLGHGAAVDGRCPMIAEAQ